MSLKKEEIALTKNPDIVTRVIDDETILLPIYKTSEEMSCIYTLNKVASRVWELINGKRTFEEIKKTVIKEFDVTSEDANKELAKLLKDLKEIKAIR